jgi:hypothetical protein
VFHGMSPAEAIEGALQIPQFIGSERPVFAMRGDPESDMTGLNSRYHEIADARKIACRLRGRRGVRLR